MLLNIKIYGIYQMKYRRLNTTKNGDSFSQETIKKVFDKGSPIKGVDPLKWRDDICGDTIKFQAYGDRDSRFGWEMDHINPVSNGGNDELENLQPLQWKNNLEKGDQLNWKCNQTIIEY